MSRKRVAILISGRGSNMAALIEAAQDPDYPAEIVLVVSNRPDAGGLATARAAGIATAVVDHTALRQGPRGVRAALQAVLGAARHRHRVPRRLHAAVDRRFRRRSGRGACSTSTLPCCPAFKGLDTHERALEAGVKIHGATVHFVVPEMDSGPIVAQGAVPVHDDDSEATLAARVLAVEHRIYPLALKLVAEGRVELDDGRCRIAGARPPEGGAGRSRRRRLTHRIWRFAAHNARCAQSPAFSAQ